MASQTLMQGVPEALHAMLIAMVECFQLADDAWFRAHGKGAVAWKTRNVVARDRLRAETKKPHHFWQGFGDRIRKLPEFDCQVYVLSRGSLSV